MQGWQVALLVIASVFVGIWIPVSLQLFATLRSGQRTLTDVSTAVVSLNQTLADVGEVAHAAAQIKDSIRIMSSIGAAVGPAVVALVRALREPHADAEEHADAETPAGGNGAPVATGSAQKESKS